ncbi:MAG: type II secretion system protein [Alphaproteobacteria bacterium]|nr:type II secretion system protein [Alphaproteobacteria bacterium]
MSPFSARKKRGFTLIELAIVLGVVASILGALWALVGIAREKARLATAIDAVTSTADNVQALYGSAPAIAGGYTDLNGSLTSMSGLVHAGVFPEALVQKTMTTCSFGGGAENYVASPWTAYSPCGAIHVCAWNYVGTTVCPATSAAREPYFAVEVTQLDYDACTALASSFAPNGGTTPVDIYINGSGVVAAGGALPVSAAIATGKCSSTMANTVDFVYRLRPQGY